MTKWLMGFLWPWTCHQINLITCLVNPCGCLCQMWGNSLEVLLSYCVHENGTDIWTIGQDGHVMPPAMTNTGTTKDNILTVHHYKKKNKKNSDFPIFTFSIFDFCICWHSPIHWLNFVLADKWNRSTGVVNSANHAETMKLWGKTLKENPFVTVQYFRQNRLLWYIQGPLIVGCEKKKM